jgi:hypothetical protein
MKLPETLLLALSAVFLLIGIHQGMTHGVQNSYFFFMISAGLFLWYTLRKKQAAIEEANRAKKTHTSKSKVKGR